jgi:hypothetical protein
MSNFSLDIQLDALESQFKAVADSLLTGSPAAVQFSGATLQRLAIEFIQMSEQVGRGQLDSPSHIRRVKELARGIASVRESLLRRLAYVDRALEIVVPATRERATYAGIGAYGNPVRQSGAFTVLSA